MAYRRYSRRPSYSRRSRKPYYKSYRRSSYGFTKSRKPFKPYDYKILKRLIATTKTKRTARKRNEIKKQGVYNFITNDGNYKQAPAAAVPRPKSTRQLLKSQVNRVVASAKADRQAIGINNGTYQYGPKLPDNYFANDEVMEVYDVVITHDNT